MKIQFVQQPANKKQERFSVKSHKYYKRMVQLLINFLYIFYSQDTKIKLSIKLQSLFKKSGKKKKLMWKIKNFFLFQLQQMRV